MFRVFRFAEISHTLVKGSNFMSARSLNSIISNLFVVLSLAILSIAQSTISGDITGVVTDPSSAVMPNAQVTLTSTTTGAVQTTNTNAQGAYRFSLLQPGRYTVESSAS